jgi:hypothetical protein
MYVFVFVWKFLTDKRYAAKAMETWFDRVTNAWCWAHEAQGAEHWSYWDRKRSPYACWNVLVFRTRARWVLIEHRAWWIADTAVRRLGLVGPDLLERLTDAARRTRTNRGYVNEPGEVYDEALVDLIIGATDLDEQHRDDVEALLGISKLPSRAH